MADKLLMQQSLSQKDEAIKLFNEVRQHAIEEK